MELRRLKRHVINRGGLAEAWLIYCDEGACDPQGNGGHPPLPRLVRAFWSCAEATEWARVEQWSCPWNRYEVYHVALDERWVSDNSLRAARHVNTVPESAPRPSIAVTPGAIAFAFR